MGFLADIGRSNMFPVAQGVFKDVMEYQQANRRDALTAVEAQQRIQESRIHKVQADELQKQQEELHRMRPFESSVFYQMTPEEDRPKLLEIARKGGYMDDNGMMSMYDRNKMLNESKEFAPYFLQTQLRKAQENVDSAMSSLYSAESSGDQGKVAKAQNALKYGLARIESLKGAHDKVATILGVGKSQDVKFGKPGEVPFIGGVRQEEIPNTLGEMKQAETERAHKESENIRQQQLEETKKYHADLAKRLSGGAGGAGSTAMMKNHAFLTSLGIPTEEATKIVTNSKPVDRKTFISQLTNGVMKDWSKPTAEEKEDAIKLGIAIYDKFTQSGGATSNNPPSGFKDSGKTSGGKKVWISPDGKSAWIEP